MSRQDNDYGGKAIDKAGKVIPEAVVVRLPLYFRVLTMLQQGNIDFVNSQDLAAQLQLTSAQIRKDLSYFGRFGKQGRGYNVGRLLGELRQILGLNRKWQVAMVGTGRLGRAIMDYKGFIPEAFRIAAAFDKDPGQIGKKVSGVVIKDTSELKNTISEQNIDIVIVAVPPAEAQEVIDKVAASGVKAILNYAPIAARVPSGVRLRGIDPVLALQSMTFHLSRNQGSKKP
ncbi:redox-sensing transcriptional repressor Rex [Chloroflexota bacterium]